MISRLLVRGTVEKDMFGTSLLRNVRAVKKHLFITKNAQHVLDFRSRMVSAHVLQMSISQFRAIVQPSKDALKSKMDNALNATPNTLLMMDNVFSALKIFQDVQSANLI